VAKGKAAAVATEDARQAKIDAVLAAMKEGNSMRKACTAQDLATSTFLGWVDASPELGEQYAGARARMLDAQAEALEEIGERAERAETAVEVAGLRLLSDNRKWLLSKLAPKKYGEKLELAGSLRVTSAAELTDDELAAIAAGTVRA
jgi:hypothetical protein